jgi:chemotaxis protein MotB
MKFFLLFLALSVFAFSGCSALSDISAEPERRRADRAELEAAVQTLQEENARLNRELQNARLESESLRGRESSLSREREALRAREKELLNRLSSNEERQRAAEARLAETEKRLAEIISGREDRHAELEKIADDFTAGLKGLGLFTVEKGPGEVRVILPAVLTFTGGGVRIVDGGEPVLRALAKVLKKHPDRHAVIEGHTDDTPISRTYSSNWELSFARAVTVLQFLEAEGVDPLRMSAAGYGKYRPRASNSTSSGREENRRVEIVVRSG